jgi:hypothetical protein
MSYEQNYAASQGWWLCTVPGTVPTSRSLQRKPLQSELNTHCHFLTDRALQIHVGLLYGYAQQQKLNRHPQSLPPIAKIEHCWSPLFSANTQLLSGCFIKQPLRIRADTSRPHGLVIKRMVYCLSAIFGVGRMLSRERSHLEAERNRSQNINRIPHDYECTNTEEAALVAPALRWISLIGGYTVLGDDVRFEEEGKRYHLDTGNHGGNADIQVGKGQFRGGVEGVDISEDPEYNLSSVSGKSGYRAVKAGLPIERTPERPRS